MSYKPIDCKRDQFRKYIESKGVIDMLTKVLIKLLDAPVKPEHPMDFIRDNLGATLFEKNQIEQLEQTVKDYKHEVEDLKFQLEEIKKKLNDKNASDSQNDVETLLSVTETNEVQLDKEPTPTPNASTVSVEESDSKISESEKAVAPTTPEVDEIKLIESAAIAETDVSVTSTTADDTPSADLSGTIEGATDDTDVIIDEIKEVTDDGKDKDTSDAAAETAKA